MQTHRELTFNGAVEFTQAALQQLKDETSRKRGLREQQAKDCTESVDKFTLVLRKQKENLEYLVGRAGERAALAD